MTRVLRLGDPVRHFWMTRSVARVVGLSLSAAMADGRLPPQEYEAMVARCRCCQRVSDCELWLAMQTGRAETAPEFCQHRDILDQIGKQAGTTREERN
ncbi:hypothetical protein SAMN04490248_10610 [Salinihabitans flavidus]|uniref:DUF6455 domain-containing protein n=1 Tax=Salinihabitans flavidus TaxID=569882 RepID=A0A1H8Q4P0_9RHOB|nr:DUF6455 family protein [Salinihabitans flavidus]SEO49222.1 hypothetical protein SAMN04490248_10610 [Salinihabitans flavidus]